MQDIIRHISFNGIDYPLAFTLNVIEKIQDKYGSYEKWGEMTDGKEQEVNIGALKFGILEMINDRKELGMQTRSKKGEEIPEDHDRRFQDFSKDTEMQAISNAGNSKDVVKEEQCVELANFDLEMLEILIDEENTTYLEALAQKLNIDKEELRKKAEALANELGGR